MSIMMSAWEQIKETFVKWQADRAPQAAGSLAFFTIFSLAPLLIVAIGIAGIIFGNEAAQEKLLGEIRHSVGPDVSRLAKNAILNAGAQGRGIWGVVIGTVALIFGATTVFAQLKGALNQMWNVEPKPGKPIRGFLRTRLISFVMVLAIGILLIGLLVVSTALNAAGRHIEQFFGNMQSIMWLIDFGISFAVVTILFAVIFKYLPDVYIGWKDVLMGSLLTSFLFTVGKLLIGFYFSRSALASVYGAAGSLVILLVWVFFSAQIFFLGAEFIHVHARHRGNPFEPSENAKRIHPIPEKQDVS
jgi:membrane protein